MRKKKILMMLAMLLTAVTGAWAQDGWEAVYRQTQTKQSDWTALSAGSTTGRTLGSADAVTYYYVTSNLSFTNSTAGGSGLKIQGTVYLYIPTGTTLTCTGANATATTGAGAGIELTQGNSLYLIGGGTLVATGGNAANGGNGGKGNDAEVNTSTDQYILGGSGGTGGNGGGGAGAGIGTRGGNGGTGGSGGQRTGTYNQETTQYGVDGNPGSAGSTAGVMGTLYVYQALAPTMNVNGGSKGSNGTGGNRGLTASQHPGSNVYMASGGGGGGAGGFGGVPLVTLHGSCTLEPPTVTTTQEPSVATAAKTLMAHQLPTVPMLSWTTQNMRTSKELASEVVPATIRMMLAGRMGTVVIPAARAAQQVLPASAAPTAP